MMIWNRECRKICRLLALWAGNDLDERDAPAIERHLAVCPRCREVWQGLDRSQRALDAARPAAPVGSSPTSVWSGVSRHIRSMDELSAARGWRDWLPTGALAAACVAVIAVLVPPLRNGDVASGLTQRSDPVIVEPGSGQTRSGSFGGRHFVARPIPAPQVPPVDPESFRDF